MKLAILFVIEIVVHQFIYIYIYIFIKSVKSFRVSHQLFKPN